MRLPVLRKLRFGAAPPFLRRPFSFRSFGAGPAARAPDQVPEPAVQDPEDPAQERRVLFEVFKDAPQLELEDSEVPAWVERIGRGPKKLSYGQLEAKFIHGVGVNTATLEEYKQFLRRHRATRMKLNNLRTTDKVGSVSRGFKRA